MAPPASPLSVGRRDLLAAVVALLAWFVLVGLLSRASRTEARAHIDRIAPEPLTRKNLGVMIQREAFRHERLLPLYGSSELVRPSEFRADQFFATFPTGFAVLPVGDRGTPPLVTFQQLVGVGRELRGRKVVILVTPSQFARGFDARAHATYAGNFSRLQAGQVAFGSILDPELERDAAHRMLAFPGVLQHDPFLRMSLNALAARGWQRRFLYPVLHGLGWLQTRVLEASDDLQILALLGVRPDLRAPPIRRPNVPDWSELAYAARTGYRARVEGHAFGFVGRDWAVASGGWERHRSTSTNQRFLAAVRSSPRWGELELIFRLLRQFEARPLVINLPFHGEYMDYSGVSAGARSVYYRRLTELAARYRIPCRTLQEHEYDPLFSIDPFHHPSPKGWIVLDSLLNSFYHDTLR